MSEPETEINDPVNPDSNADLDSLDIEKLIEAATRSLLTLAPQLPSWESVQEALAFGRAAAKRGYFLPNEDEAVRTLFSKYLTTRAALLETLEDLRPHALAELSQPNPRHPEIFIVSFCAACLLVRSGRFLIDSFRKERVIWRKLDEAEPRFGIPAKQFTKVYRSLTSPANIWVFLEAARYWRENKAKLNQTFANDPIVKPLLVILAEEEPFIETSKRYYATGRLKYRLHSFFRRNHSGYKNVTFELFRLSGRVISEIRLKWKRKRITPGVLRKFSKLLQPGDVVVTRHDDAATNLFLPGFWPHGVFYIGTQEQRDALGIDPIKNLADHTSAFSKPEDPICILEARKDGVLYRSLADALNVDACVLIRPNLTPEKIREGINRAMTHAGKEYDFEFDFRRSTKLVCTEVVYRAFHGCDPIHFELNPRMGRVCLSAQDLLDTAFDNQFFKVIAIYGVDGNRFAVDERAKELLASSYRTVASQPADTK